MGKAKRQTRACLKCHHRQYYRKTTDDWRCDKCGFISNGSQIEEKKKYVLIQAKKIPPKRPSKYRHIFEEFMKNKHKVDYIQFDDKEEMVLVYAGLIGLRDRRDMNINVRMKSELLRIYLEKL